VREAQTTTGFLKKAKKKFLLTARGKETGNERGALELSEKGKKESSSSPSSIPEREGETRASVKERKSLRRRPYNYQEKEGRRYDPTCIRIGGEKVKRERVPIMGEEVRKDLQQKQNLWMTEIRIRHSL